MVSPQLMTYVSEELEVQSAIDKQSRKAREEKLGDKPKKSMLASLSDVRTCHFAIWMSVRIQATVLRFLNSFP